MEKRPEILYTENMEEVFEILRQCGQKPAYENIGKDEEGCELAVPCFVAK